MSEDRLEKLRDELSSTDRNTRTEALKQIVSLQGKEAVPIVLNCLKDRDKSIRVQAFVYLIEFTGVEYHREIVRMWQDGYIAQLYSVQKAFRKLNATQLETLLNERNHPNPQVRAYLAQSLKGKQSEAIYSTLIILLEDPNKFVRISAAGSLGQCGNIDAVPHLIKRLRDAELLVRSVSAESLGELGDLRALDPLLDALKYEIHFRIRRGLVYGLGGMIDERAANALYTIATDPQEDVDMQSSVVTALVKMQTFGESTLRRIAKNAPNTETRADAQDALRMYFRKLRYTFGFY